jgi:two-component system, OmpR family, sensor histidine kinase CreC
VRELVDRAARISRGDRDAFQPLAHYGAREFAQLSHSFLDMAQQLSRRSDYSSHLTHELKSPLTSIKGARPGCCWLRCRARPTTSMGLAI